MNSNKTFSKPAIVVILVLALALVAETFLWQKDCKSNGKEKAEGLESKSTADFQQLVTEINALKADTIGFKKAQTAYKYYARLDSIYHTGATSRLFDFQKGFMLDMRSMKEFQTADSLYFGLGLKPNNIINGYYPDKYTLYILGMKNDSIIMHPTDKQYPLVYEYLKPCPDACPEKICKVLYDNNCH